MSKWQHSLEGGLKFGMSESVVMEGDKTLASERFNVKAQDKKLTKEIDHLHDTQMELCEQIRGHANSKGIEIYQKLLFKVRWADPELSLWQQSLITDYVQHLLGPDPKRIFPGERIMRAMFEKTLGRRAEKAHGEILKLINRIRSIILYNDGKVADIKSALKDQESLLLKKKGGQLRWLIESNAGRKDRFWTTWYFASRGMAAPLQRHLKSLKKKSDEKHLEKTGGGLEGEEGWGQKLARDEDWKKGITPTSKNDVDARDPDFGMTALHYASKTSNSQVVKILLDYHANPNIRAPDGRTALHFAAAYGTRQIVAMLLGSEADIDAIDNFGCSAEVLAEQNENRPTWLVLQRWRTLVPELPDRPLTPEVVEKLIPETYQTVAEDVLERMSKPLQAIARRLTPPEDMLESAQEFMEVKEESRKEAEWQRFRETGVSESALLQQDETIRLENEKRKLGFTDATVELTDEMRLELEADKARQEEKDYEEKNRVRKGKPMNPIAELRLCQKFAEMCFREGFVDEGIRGLRRRWDAAKKLFEATNERLRRMHEHRRNHHANTLHAHSNRRASTVNKPAGLHWDGDVSVESSATEDLSSLDTEDLSVAGDERYAKVQKDGGDYSLHACVETGRELAEALVKYDQEGFAATVLEECLMLTGVPKLVDGAVNLGGTGGSPNRKRVGEFAPNEDSQTIIPPQTNLEPSGTVALLARRCEVLLCVWDILLNEQGETSRTLPFPLTSEGQYAAHYEDIRRESVQSIAETLSPSKASLIQNLADAPVDYSKRGVKPGGLLDQPSMASIDEHNAFPSIVDQLPPDKEASFAMRQPRASEEDSQAWYDGSFALSPTKAFMDQQNFVEIPPAPYQPSVSSVESQDFVGFGYHGRNFSLYQRILTVAVQCRDSIDLAIDIVTTGSADLLVEPYVLVPLLELRAEVFERENDYENSVLCLTRAENCCKRSIGLYTDETVAIMIEVLRLLIKCETPEGYKAATEKANELTLVIDKISKTRRDAREAEERKKTDVFEIMRQRKRLKEEKAARARALAEANEGKSDVSDQVYSDPNHMIGALENEEDEVRLGKSGRRGGVSMKSNLNEDDDVSVFFRRAMELISLAKLLDGKMETVPDLFGPGAGLGESKLGTLSRASVASKSKGLKHKSAGSKMDSFSIVNNALGKKKESKAREGLGNPNVYTGRAPSKEDRSQTLSRVTSDSVIQDGHHVKVTKGSKSASTAPHEHIKHVKSVTDSSKANADPSLNTGNKSAMELAMAGLRASRMLSRPVYYQVPKESRVKRVFVPVPVVMDEPEKVEETSSAYFSQLQARSLTHDVTKAAVKRSQQLQRELSSSLRTSAYESSFVSEPAVGMKSPGPRKSKGVALGDYDTTVEEAVLAGGRNSSSVSGVSNRMSILPQQRLSEITGGASGFSLSAATQEMTRPGSPLTAIQKSDMNEQQEDIDRIIRVSSQSDYRPSPYDSNPAQLKAGFGSIAASASYVADKTLSASQKLVLANVHSTVNLSNKHRLEKLMEQRPALAGLLSLSAKGRRGGISGAGEAETAKWAASDTLLQRDSSLVLDGSVSSSEAKAAESAAFSSRGVGSILHTGSAVVSIPHTTRTVAVAPHIRKAGKSNPQGAARAVSSAISLGEAAGCIGEASYLESGSSIVSTTSFRSSKPRGRDVSSNRYSDKHNIGSSDVPLMRYKNGDWQVQYQSEKDASREMVQDTSLASLGRSIREIEEEREKLTEDKTFYL
jgi:hypothetical protein